MTVMHSATTKLIVSILFFSDFASCYLHHFAFVAFTDLLRAT